MLFRSDCGRALPLMVLKEEARLIKVVSPTISTRCTIKIMHSPLNSSREKTSLWGKERGEREGLGIKTEAEIAEAGSLSKTAECLVSDLA